MRQCGRWTFGTVLAALLLPGCQLFRPHAPEAPAAAKKDPFSDDDPGKGFVVPKVVQMGFKPPDFPVDKFEHSQRVPVAAVDPMPAQRHEALGPKPQLPAPITKREPLAEALQCILENRHDEALAHLQAYDAPTQDLFLRLLPALSILSKKKLTELTAAEVSVLHEQLYSLLGTLRPRTPLTIDKACFCEAVVNYGNYKPLSEGHAFAAPSVQRPGELVQLYVELRNFASELRLGAFETRLSSSVEICDSRGELVWSYRFEDEKQPIRSRTQLHDLHNNYTFHVPKNLPPGNYRLTIQVVDETTPESRRVARQTLDFRVAPAPVRTARN